MLDPRSTTTSSAPATSEAPTACGSDTVVDGGAQHAYYNAVPYVRSFLD